MLTVELSNFPRSRINGASFQTRVSIFSIVLYREESRCTPLDFQKARQDRMQVQVFFRVNIGAVSEVGSIANLASLFNLLFL